MLKSVIGFIVLSALVITVPSLRDLMNCFYLGTHTLCIVVLILAGCLIMHKPYSIIFAGSMLLAYRRNIDLTFRTLFRLFKLGWIESVKDRANNQKLQFIMHRDLTALFRLETDFSLYNPEIPSIIVANYCQDRFENMASMLIPGDVTVMMRDGLLPVLGKLVKWQLVTREKNCYDETKAGIKASIAEGRSVLTYATKYNKLRPSWVFKIRSGIFHIARELGVPITLLAVDWIEPGVAGIIEDQRFGVKASAPFYVKNVQEDMHKARLFFTEKLGEFGRRHFTEE